MTESGKLLVGSIGTTDYDDIEYELNGRTVRTDTALSALVNLCDVDAALIFRTSEAGDKNDARLREAFSEAGVAYEFVEIELVTGKADIDTILQTVVTRIRDSQFSEDSVMLDISHSFRTLPMVFLVSLMQLTALEETVTLDKIYYSRFAGSDEHSTAPIIDLTYLRTMMEWYDAFQTAQRTGTYQSVQALLEEKREKIYGGNTPTTEDRQFINTIGTFGGAQKEIDEGFPLTAGLKTQTALEALSELDDEAFIGPEQMVMEPLELILEGFETNQDVTDKTDLVLDTDELRRQANMIAFYVDHNKYLIAIECARELMINRFLYDAGITDQWLDKETRQDVAPAPSNQGDHGTHDVDKVQALWEQISDARNAYAHAGFKRKNRSSHDKIEAWLKTLCGNIDNDSFWTADSA